MREPTKLIKKFTVMAVEKEKARQKNELFCVLVEQLNEQLRNHGNASMSVYCVTEEIVDRMEKHFEDGGWTVMIRGSHMYVS